MYDDYVMQGTPSVWFDGGWSLFRGSPASGEDYAPYIEQEGARPVNPVGLDVSLQWLGGGDMEITVTVDALDPGPCCVTRGNVDRMGDPAPDIGDLIYLVTYMFQGGEVPECMVEADINGSGGIPDIGDLIHLVNYMFQEGPEPAACP